MSTIRDQYHLLMVNLFKEIYPSMVTNKGDRVSHSLHLGLTNRRLHDLDRLTITGMCAPTLISTKTKMITISNSALKKLGRLIVFILRQVIPEFKMYSYGCNDCPKARELIAKFGLQLGLQGDDLECFTVPGISIVINDNLYPHVDTMNPREQNWIIQLD